MFWDNIFEGLLVLTVGMTGVLSVLFLFYLIIEGVNKLEIFLVEKQKNKAERAKTIIESENEDDLVAILTAAASVTLSSKIRIKQIRFIKSQPVSPWATLGRMNLISSHNIQKNQ